MPELNWIGKQHVVNHAEEVPFRLLRKAPDSSEGVADSGNMILHGDNLEALKALLPYYRGRVKLVFIDPPYNTGNEGWSYNDRMNAPKLKKWFGKVVGGEGEDLSRHDKWLSMMYPRLELLRDLLSEDGSLWMTVDDNEAHYAKVLMDEIFGRTNFIATVVWERVFAVKNTAKYFSDDHDYVLIYAKNAEVWRPNLVARTAEQEKDYKNPDSDPRGPWQSVALSARNPYSKGIYLVEAPSGKTISGPPQGRYWSVSKEKLEELDADGRIWWGPNQDRTPRRKTFLSEVKDGIVPRTIWSHEQAGHTQDAKKELNRIMDFFAEFVTPKPVKLLQRILQVATDRDSIVLDSFAGSGTTAHAVLKQNAEDGGERKFVLVEMEDYASSLTAERVRRVIRGSEAGGQPFLGAETGFDFYELAGELFTALGERINPEVDKEALGRFAFFLETGLALDAGAAGTFGANGTAFVGGGRDRDLYLFYEPGGTTVFGRKELAALPGEVVGNGNPTIVYADRCAVDDEELVARGVSFRKIPRDLKELMSRYGKGRAR